jgi:putative ABC transport system ATP-binding protein
MIKLKDITKVYAAGTPGEFRALRGVSLEIDEGGATVIRGPSGSGKTTLLSVLGCMSRPTTGRVWLRDREITSLPERFLTDIRRRAFGFVFQHFNLIRGVSAIENAMLPAYPTGEPRREVEERAGALMQRFGIYEKAGAKAQHLSGGEAQRVAVVRALINSPEVIIADEPTAHLDTALARETMDIFSELLSEGRTLVIASHDPLVTDSGIAGRVVDIRDGLLA